MEKRFSYEQRQFVLAFRKNQLIFYEKFHHDPYYSWWDEQTQNPKQVKNPIRLVRQIWRFTRQFIYESKISYFEIVVSDFTRSRIYGRFLRTLSGFKVVQYGYSFAVFKIK